MANPVGIIMHAWNAFRNKEPTRTSSYGYTDYGVSTWGRPDRPQVSFTNEKSIVMAIYTRIANDVAQMDLQHVTVDDNEMFKNERDSYLNECLKIAPNMDQNPSMFMRDLVIKLFDYGVVAVVPVDTTEDPEITGAYDINSMRIGRIVEWRTTHVRVDLYNELTGIHEEVTLEKSMTAIIENPFYAVMNESSSTLSRLKEKLRLLDVVDNQSSSGKLDIIIQLPYTIRNEEKRKQANKRRADMEEQLSGSKYGIAYSDATEKITQLNRPAENNLMKQVEYLTSMLYSQLSITQSIMDGTADDTTMTNYFSRTIEPILKEIVEQYQSKFLTKTARTKGQRIMYFRDAFKLVPVSQLADLADKLTRNEILTPNEVRAIIGYRPSKDPKADELRNRNINEKSTGDTSQDAINPNEGKET